MTAKHQERRRRALERFEISPTLAVTKPGYVERKAVELAALKARLNVA